MVGAEVKLRPSVGHINLSPQLLRESKFDVYRFTRLGTWEVYWAFSYLCSRLAYKVWYVIMLSLYLGLGDATRDKPHVRRGKETLVKVEDFVTRNIILLDYVMLISIFFVKVFSRMVLFTGFWFFLMMFPLHVDNWVPYLKLELSGQALWRVRVLVND